LKRRPQVLAFSSQRSTSIPPGSLDPGDRRFVQAFNAETGNLIKGGAAMLKSVVRSRSIGAERFLACLASISMALSPTGLIETKTDDISGNGFSR
jgi:hypothetical protein